MALNGTVTKFGTDIIQTKVFQSPVAVQKNPRWQPFFKMADSRLDCYFSRLEIMEVSQNSHMWETK